MDWDVGRADYRTLEYDTKGRFCSYWHQIAEVVSLKPAAILEIGVGNGLVATYLKERSFSITTVDIDESLSPDCVASASAIAFADNAFDAVLCCQVLEHLPFEGFLGALSEIHRVTRLHAVLSLPDAGRVYRISLQIPKIGRLQGLIPLPWLSPSVHDFGGQHYWEIGKAGYGLPSIVAQIQNVGFEIVTTYRVFEKPRHRFFVLQKA